MSKKSRKKKRRNKNPMDVINKPARSISWQDTEGVHFVAPGLPQSPEKVAEMTKRYQEHIRNSPLWDQIVRDFGPEKAEELLKECQVKIKPG